MDKERGSGPPRESPGGSHAFAGEEAGVIALSLSYDGSAFHGWQSQKNASSVQDAVTKALEALFNHPVTLHGCGRTDAGVHAAVYVASFRGRTNIPMDKLPFALNAHLPESVSVRGAWCAPDTFHARFSCLKKRYTYTVCTGKTRDPLCRRYAWHYPKGADVSVMAEAARHLVGRRDFAALRSQGTPVKSTVRTVYDCSVCRRGDFVTISVTADGFLYNMARAVAGTLLYVSAGKLKPEEVPGILSGKDRTEAGPTAPAHGLCLTGLWYPDFSFTDDWPFRGRPETVPQEG